MTVAVSMANAVVGWSVGERINKDFDVCFKLWRIVKMRQFVLMQTYVTAGTPANKFIGKYNFLMLVIF